MPPTNPLLRLAQAASICLSLLSSGVALAESFLIIPRLLESPVPLMLHQWTSTLITSKRIFRATTLPAATVFYLLSWYSGRGGGGRTWKLYLAAGILCSSVGPYTWVVVMPTNRKLMRRGEECVAAETWEEPPEVTVQRQESARWLVDHWGMLNLPRAIVLGVAGALGIVAAQEG